MCGIVAATARREVSEILLEGLRRLEYRGYDSAGMALVDNENGVHPAFRGKYPDGSLKLYVFGEIGGGVKLLRGDAVGGRRNELSSGTVCKRCGIEIGRLIAGKRMHGCLQRYGFSSVT